MENIAFFCLASVSISALVALVWLRARETRLMAEIWAQQTTHITENVSTVLTTLLELTKEASPTLDKRLKSQAELADNQRQLDEMRREDRFIEVDGRTLERVDF